MVIGMIVGGLISIFGMLFRNSVMQLVGGAIFIYALGVLHILPTWMIVLISILFIYLVTKK